MTEPTPTGPKYRVEMWDDNGKKIVDFEEQGRWDGSVAPPVTLADFLRARLDEDAAAARRCDRGAWATVDWNSMSAEQHGTRHDPTRVLAEVEAKRRIVEEHATEVERVSMSPFDPITGVQRPAEWDVTCRVCGWADDDLLGGCATVKLLALPYAGHPSYREEWRP